MRLTLILCLVFSTNVFSANRYWVGQVHSNWNNTSNWSSTSGGPGGSSVPIAADLAIFDGLAGIGNCTLDIPISVLGLYLTGYTGNFLQGANQITTGLSGFSQTSGNFTGGTGNIIVNSTGVFTLSGGNFTSTSSSLTIAGTRNSGQYLFTHSGGVFSNNNGTLTINPTNGCAAVTHFIDVISTTEFYNIILNAVNTCGNIPIINTASGDILNVSNDFTHSDGVMNGLLSLKNNLIVNVGADAGSGTIFIEGSDQQTYSIAAGTTRTCGIVINKPALSFAPAIGTTNLYLTRFTLQAGDFTAPPGLLNIGGTWNTSQTLFTHAAGNFNHNNGTVVINPLNGCAAVTHTLDVEPATEFYDFQINATNTCGNIPVIITATGDIINITNNLTHTDGVINGSFEVKNNLIVGTGADAGTGTITFNGTTEQTYSVSASGPRTCGIVINKIIGSVKPSIETTQFLVQKFTLQSGDFTAPSGQLNIGGTWNSSQTLFNHVSGNFDHNNGTLAINPLNGCAAVTHTLDVIPTTEFYNIQINANNTCGNIPVIATAVGDVVNATHDLTHTNGMISGSFSVKNDLVIDPGADAGSGTIIFDGKGIQYYTVSSGTPRTCGIIVNKSTGEVLPGAGTSYFAIQKFTLQEGDFTAPTNQLNIGGTWNTSQTLFHHVSGNFYHNKGTVKIKPLNGCAAVTHTLNVIPTTEFYDIQIDANNTCGNIPVIVTAVGDVVNVSNDFTHSDGVINGLFAVKNNLSIEAGADAGTGTITFDGTGDQSYIVVSGTPRTCGITINKTSGAVTAAPGTTNLFIQKFALLSGDFSAPSGNLNIGGTWNTSQTLFNHTFGNFYHNNGTMIINPLNGCAVVTHTLDVNPSTEFKNIIINANNTCGNIPVINTAAGDIVNAINNFTHSDGVINGLFAVKNNLIIEAGADAGSGTITFDGTGNQSYSIVSGTPRTCGIVVNKASGIVSPDIGTTQFFIQKFALQAGEFTAPTGSFNIGGIWNTSQTLFNHISGLYNHNQGTLAINPTNGCAAVTHILNVIPSTAFFNLQINAINTCGNIPNISIATNDTLHILNQLNLTDGRTVNRFMQVMGNVIIEPTFDPANTTELILAGSANTMIDATGAIALYDGRIKINKTNAFNTVTLNSALQLDATSQSVTFVKGRIINSSSTLLILGNNVTAVGASDSSHVAGLVRKIGNNAFTFPVGKQARNSGYYYRPISISAPGNVNDQFTAEYFHVDPDSFYDTDIRDLILDHVGRCEYWILDRNAGTSNVNVTLSWRDSTSCGVTNVGNLRVARWDGLQWKDHGNGGFTGNNNSGTVVTFGPVTNFSPFTLASTTRANPLPISLVSFEGQCNNNSPKLSWATGTEVNNDFFTIERSEDAITWVVAGVVKGGGNSNDLLYYEFTDKKSKMINPYYRLKQTDFDGRSEYSNMIKVTCPVKIMNDLSIYPNPTTGKFTIINNFEETVQISVFDMPGKLVLSTTILSDNINYIDLTGLEKGVYLIKYNVDNLLNTQKLIVN